MLHFVAAGPRYVSPSELADMLGISRAGVYKLIKQKRLIPTKVPMRNGRGFRLMFALEDATRWARELQEQKQNEQK